MAVPQITGYADLTAIGQGGFAVVYRARQTALNRPVAVKVLSGLIDPVAVTRFERECATIGSLSGHPHVVSVYDAGTTLEGSPYLAMEYLPRGSLADRVNGVGPMATPDILRIGVQLCDALEAAHRAGVLHRDIKPENVLLDSAGECKLADFGVAAVVEAADSRDTAPGALLGTVLHLAPEVLEGGRASITSDIYSLGSTLASLSLGRAPFARSGDDTVIPLMMRIVREPLPDLRAAGLDDRVAAAIEMAMAKEAGERFGSAAAFGNALQQIQRRIDLPVTPMRAERPTLPPLPRSEAATAIAPAVAVTTSLPQEPRPPDEPDDPARSHRWVAIVAALAIALVAGTIGFAATRDDDDPSGSTTTATTATTATTSTTTAPLPGEPAATTTEAILAAETYKGLGLQVTDRNAYRGARGLAVLIAHVPDGRQYLVVFYDGHLIGLDWSEPSWTVGVHEVTADSLTADYALYAAGQRPPAEPVGTKRIVFAWDPGTAHLIPENGPAPTTDQAVDGHR